MRLRSPDFWSGLALAALGGYTVHTARGWESLGQDGPGPGFFPLWYGIAILALSLILVVRGEGQAVSWRGAGRAFATWGAFAVSVVLLKLVGFVVGFAALTFFLVAVMYRLPLAVAALVAVGTTAGFYLVFPLALGVQLP